MKTPESLLGYTVIGGFFTGLVSLVAALAAAIQGDWPGVGLSLIAAALAFGLAANAILRT